MWGATSLASRRGDGLLSASQMPPRPTHKPRTGGAQPKPPFLVCFCHIRTGKLGRGICEPHTEFTLGRPRVSAIWLGGLGGDAPVSIIGAQDGATHRSSKSYPGLSLNSLPVALPVVRSGTTFSLPLLRPPKCNLGQGYSSFSNSGKSCLLPKGSRSSIPEQALPGSHPLNPRMS